MGRLYVFLHGLFAVSEDGALGSEMQIILPAVHQHVYRAGSWLMETTIRARHLTLENVEGGDASLSTRNVLHLNGAIAGSRGRTCTLHFPRPKSILDLRRVTLPEGVRATAHVFEYQYADETRVSLRGHYWEPYSHQGAVSLHIVSSPEEQVGAKHEAHINHALRYLLIRNFSGYALSARPPVPRWNSTQVAAELAALGFAASSSNDSVVTAAGEYAFLLAELEDPAPRAKRLNRMGRMKQQGRPLEGLWHEPDPLGEEVDTCELVHLSN